MWSNSDVLEYATSTVCGENVDIYLIDFFGIYSNVPFAMRKKHGEFRDEFIRRFPNNSLDSPEEKGFHWTVELIYSEMTDQVIHFNDNFQVKSECDGLIIVCLDNKIDPHQEARLKSSYIKSHVFQFDSTYLNINYERIFDYLQGKSVKDLIRRNLMNFDPYFSHINTIGSGLVFNYYFSYLNKQITTTNNIFLTFCFEKCLSCESFPSSVSVMFVTLIEETFLDDFPSTVDSDVPKEIHSILLQFKCDRTTYQSDDQNGTVISYSLVGTNDFGSSVEKVHIWQENFDLNALRLIQLKDSVRKWQEEYQSCSTIERENLSTNSLFKNREDSIKTCQFYPISDAPSSTNRHSGISTMKKTSRDCYESYIESLQNIFSKDNPKITKIFVVPVYYILMPSSCQFGPSDINQLSQCDERFLHGTIIDPDIRERIRLAYANGEVLRSAEMLHCNRYFRRTYYYVDEIDDQDNIFRYLFCAEYPYILSILHQLETIGQISSNEKHEEYLRFYNMLDRLIHLNNLNGSVKLIPYNDQSNENDVDVKPLWNQIKEDIDRYYQTSYNNIDPPSIESMIFPSLENHHILLFFTNQTRRNAIIWTLINDLKMKLESRGYIVEDAHGDFNSITSEKRIVFLLTRIKNKKINRLIIKIVKEKMSQFGALRDVFLLINQDMTYRPCRFIQSIPYLQRGSTILNDQDIEEIIYFFNNMNILAKSYRENVENINKSSSQCTSIADGCAAAFYYNYVKLITSSSDHQHRMELIDQQLKKENLLKYFSKWIFIIPSTIESTNEIFPYVLSINEEIQNEIGFKLSLWKTKDLNLIDLKFITTVGGVYQRSYSPLIVYKLTNLKSGENSYFPMEIPAALHGLQNQYENFLSHFHFGRFDPQKQGLTFQKRVKEFHSNDPEKSVLDNVVFLPFDNLGFLHNSIEQTKILLETLWQTVSSSDESMMF